MAFFFLPLSQISLAAEGPELHRYWPRFPRPEIVLRVPFQGDHEEGMVFETAAGLAARELLAGRGNLLLCEDSENTAYQRWFRMMQAVVKPQVQGPVSTWEAVGRLRDLGIIQGAILYRYDRHDRPWHETGKIDESANVATSLASLLNAVAVSERLRPRAEELGLKVLLDVRDKTEAECLREYGDHFTRRLLMTADPKSRVARTMAVATGAFVVSQPGKVYDAALARCRGDSPILGWGCGGEAKQTLPSSQWGLFQTATNWCHNLPLLSTETPGESIPTKSVKSPRHNLSLSDIEWETRVHYVTFIMSDGDNVQWLMGNFCGGTEGRWYYESGARGRFAFGWTFPYVSLAQLCPYALIDLFSKASSRDDFVLYGTGYLYPDHFGSQREGDCLRLHASRMAEYMRLGGLKTVAYNLQDWDSEEALDAYGTLLYEVPFLEGIFTVQYYPYSAGEGRVLWIKGPEGHIPVVSCRLCIWAQTGRPHDTTPAGVAKWINSYPRGGPQWSENHFTFVMPHCWSRFRDTHGDASITAEEEGVVQDKDVPGVYRGLMPVAWAVDRLDEDIRVVTPTEFLMQMRLRLRTRQTLASLAADLEEERGTDPDAAESLAKAKRLIQDLKDGSDDGKKVFDLLKRIKRTAPGSVR